MRAREGEALAVDLRERLVSFASEREGMESLAPLVPERYRCKLLERLASLPQVQPDEERLLQEVLYYAEKADITEELTRLKSHERQFVGALEVREPVGRRLDFLLQEMLREVNTIGAKANDTEIAVRVVAAKGILEKLKEQVQNIE
jgi:uncharacterized protein (TIGR00255 family)